MTQSSPRMNYPERPTPADTPNAGPVQPVNWQHPIPWHRNTNDPYTQGQLHVRIIYQPAAKPYLEVTHADPRILITDELLTQLHEQAHSPWVRLVVLPGATVTVKAAPKDSPIPDPFGSLEGFVDIGTFEPDSLTLTPRDEPFEGATLHIETPDRKYIYQIGKHRWPTNLWEAAWPD